MLCLTASHKVSFFHWLAKGSASALITWLLKTTVSKNAAKLDLRQIVLDLGTHWLKWSSYPPSACRGTHGFIQPRAFLSYLFLTKRHKALKNKEGTKNQVKHS